MTSASLGGLGATQSITIGTYYPLEANCRKDRCRFKIRISTNAVGLWLYPFLLQGL
jgi:hypothetical protein